VAAAAAIAAKNASDPNALPYHASIENADTQDAAEADIGIEREDLLAPPVVDASAHAPDPELAAFDVATVYAGGRILVLGSGVSRRLNRTSGTLVFTCLLIASSLLHHHLICRRRHWACACALAACAPARRARSAQPPPH